MQHNTKQDGPMSMNTAAYSMGIQSGSHKCVSIAVVDQGCWLTVHIWVHTLPLLVTYLRKVHHTALVVAAELPEVLVEDRQGGPTGHPADKKWLHITRYCWLSNPMNAGGARVYNSSSQGDHSPCNASALPTMHQQPSGTQAPTNMHTRQQRQQGLTPP